MTVLQGLLVAIDVARRKRDDAGVVLSQVQRRCDSAQGHYCSKPIPFGELLAILDQ